MTTRILIIDPDIAFMVSVKQGLESTGEFDVTVSGNGWAAQEALRHLRHDAAVIAFDVPDMDVMELIVQLRSVQADLPVIVVPQDEAEQDRVRFLDVQGAIRKPFAARDLIPYVRSVLTRIQGGSPPPAPDEFVPPEMPASVKHLIDQSRTNRPTPSPTQLLDEVERQQIIEPEVVDFELPPDEIEIAPPAEPPVTPAPDGQTVFLSEPESQDTILDEFEVFEPGGTRMLSDDEAPSPADTKRLEEEDSPPGTTGLLEWKASDETAQLGGTRELPPPPPRSAGTVRFTEDSEPSDEQDRLEWQEEAEPDPAQPLDHLMEEHGWLPGRGVTHLLGESYYDDEPPRDEGDTPPLPLSELDSLYIPPENIEQEPVGFEDVLDVIAQAPPGDSAPAPDDRFDELVNSMRSPRDRRAGAGGLEDLLASIAADAERGQEGEESDDSDSTLDYVLDAIRRGKSPQPEFDFGESDLGDSTIGDLIEGLFDPSFEGVLTALAGGEIEETGYDEPSYGAREGVSDRTTPSPADQFSLDEMSANEDRPDWLVEYEMEGVPPTLPEQRPRGPRIEEPPIVTEDSSGYPATAALEAVREADREQDFSLDDLLVQIEEQLPPAHTRRPKLKPLPSWEQEELRQDDRLAAMFDRFEGRAPTPPPEVPAPPPPPAVQPLPRRSQEAADAEDVDAETIPLPDLTLEPDVYPQDTRPSAAMLRDIESVPVQETDTSPVRDLEAQAEAEDAARDYADYDEGTIEPDAVREPVAEEAPEQDEWIEEPNFDLDEEDVLSIAELIAMADLPPEEVKPVIQEEAASVYDEAFYAGVETEAYDYEAEAAAETEDMVGTVDEEPTWLADAEEEIDTTDEEPAWLAEAEEEIDTADEEPAWLVEAEETVEPADEEPAWLAETDLAPDDSHLIPVPAVTVARLLGGEQEDEEDERLARAAVQLTQYSLESSAQATMLSRPGECLASAGDLPDAAVDRLFEIVERAWRRSTGESDSLIRYITLPDAGEFLLYSTLVDADLFLSMVFHANTPVRTIRRQARRLSESLEYVVEEIEDSFEPEPPVSETLPSRPTDLRPPSGLREAVVAPPERVPRPDEPYTAYTCLWLPDDPGQELLGDFADDLAYWIEEIADASAWDLTELIVQADYVQATVSVPHKTSPNDVLTRVMTETAARTADTYPDVLDHHAPLWADGYYVVAPPRDLTEREIARFITYQRQAQLG